MKFPRRKPSIGSVLATLAELSLDLPRKRALFSVAGLSIVAAGAAITFVFVYGTKAGQVPPPNINLSLAQNLANCESGASLQASQCYDVVMKEYFENNSPESLLEQFRLAMEQNGQVRRDCHQVAHAIGRATLVKLGNISDVFDLERNIDTCAGGVFHGAIEKMFRPDNDVPADEHISLSEFEAKVPTLCDQFETANLKSECVHGVGHGAFYFLSDTGRSFEVCRQFPDTSDHFSCYSGVFMEYDLSGASIKDNASDPDFPCDTLENPYRNPCYYVLSFRLVDLGILQDEIVPICRKAESRAAQALCVRGYGIFYLAHEALAKGYDPVVAFCETLDRTDSRVCAEAVASRLAAYSQGGEHAMPFCTEFSSNYIRGRCFAYTADVLRVGHGINAGVIKEECGKYLEGRYREECLKAI